MELCFLDLFHLYVQKIAVYNFILFIVYDQANHVAYVYTISKPNYEVNSLKRCATMKSLL